MKLIIIRHGDPDYEKDSLTPTGWKEAELLSEKIACMNVKDYYVSPLGRARDTASFTLKKCRCTAKVLDWLREFDFKIDEDRPVVWDMLPSEWTCIPEYYSKDNWYDVEKMKNADIKSGIEYVNNGLDEILEEHGYKRENNIYRAVSPNEDTIVMFCHFGVECIMLGHLLGISPMVLWHGFIALPTSVTTLVTEERREGTAYFRLNGFGDVSHLKEPSFAGRFCEMFSNKEQRHD